MLEHKFFSQLSNHIKQMVKYRKYVFIILLALYKNFIFAYGLDYKDTLLKSQNDFLLYLNENELNDIYPYDKYKMLNQDSVINVNINGLYQGLSNKPKMMMNLFFYGKSNNISFFFEPMITNKDYGEKILGMDYERSGISGRIQKSYISIEKPLYTFRFGRFPIFWGESTFGSIIQSGLYPAYDNAMISYKFGKLKYDMLLGTLSSKKNSDGFLIRRYLSGKRISIQFNKSYSVSAGEQILYTGQNRQISIRYMNPFTPYFLTGLEENERDSKSDNDNSMLFFHQRYVFNNNSSIFNELIIDDYQIDDSGLDHAIGVKLGYDKIFSFINNKCLLVLEYTNISPLTYIHHGEYTSWQNLNHNIGYPLGTDIENIQLKFYVKNKKNRIINIELDYLLKGENNTNSLWAWNEILNNQNNLTTKHLFFKLGLIYNMNWGFIELAWQPINKLNSKIVQNDYFNNKNEAIIKLVYNIKKSINTF